VQQSENTARARLRSRSAIPSPSCLRAGLPSSSQQLPAAPQPARRGPHRAAPALGVPFPTAISAWLSALPAAPYLPGWGETRRSSYSFTNLLSSWQGTKMQNLNFGTSPRSRGGWRAEQTGGSGRRQHPGPRCSPALGYFLLHVQTHHWDNLEGSAEPDKHELLVCVPAGSQMCWEPRQLQLT